MIAQFRRAERVAVSLPATEERLFQFADFDQIEIRVAQIDRPNRACRARSVHWAFGDRDTLIAQ